MPILGFELGAEFGDEPFDTGAPVADTNIKRLIAAATMGAQDLENALQQLLTQRDINTAVGVQLDVIGAIVGQPRNGLDDETYRRYCRARIAAHRSKGSIEDLIRVIDLVVFDNDALLRVVNDGTATIRIRIEDISTTDALAAICFSFGEDAAAAGVRVIFEWSPVEPDTWMLLDGDDPQALDGGIMTDELAS